MALADGAARSARLGSRLSLDSGLTLSLEATRSEHAVDAPQHTFAPSGALRFLMVSPIVSGQGAYGSSQNVPVMPVMPRHWA